MAVFGLPIQVSSNGYEVPTAFGSTLFGLIAGVGGAVGNLVAGSRLSDVSSGTIPLRALVLPTAVSILASAGAGYLIPTSY